MEREDMIALLHFLGEMPECEARTDAEALVLASLVRLNAQNARGQARPPKTESRSSNVTPLARINGTIRP